MTRSGSEKPQPDHRERGIQFRDFPARDYLTVRRGRLLRRFPFFCFACTLFCLMLLGSCSKSVGPATTRTEFMLGTTCTISPYEKTKEAVLNGVFERVREIEEKMSFRRDTSEVAEINRSAGKHPVKVSEDTFHICERALRFSERSDGAFDITIGPLVELWGTGTEDAAVPPKEAIEKLLPLVDYRKVKMDHAEQTVYLPVKGMKIDLGGIAKGYAADEAARVLREEGVSKAIVDFGGNIYALGAKEGEDGKEHKPAEENTINDSGIEKVTPWRIGIQHPRTGRGNYIGIVETVDKAFVSSGDYERYFTQDGTRYHHILDTETGYPVRNKVISVTIISKDALEADALSTAVFSLGVEKGLDLIESTDGTEGIIVTDEDLVYLSRQLKGKDSFRLVDSSFTVVDDAAGGNAR